MTVSESGYTFFGWFDSEFEIEKAWKDYAIITNIPENSMSDLTFYGKLIKSDAIGEAGYSDATIKLEINFGEGLKANSTYGMIMIEYTDSELGYTRRYTYSLKEGEITISGLKYAEYSITIKTTFKTTVENKEVELETSYKSTDTVVINVEKKNTGGYYDIIIV